MDQSEENYPAVWIRVTLRVYLIRDAAQNKYAIRVCGTLTEDGCCKGMCLWD